jgi:hypothetical protein
MRRFVLILVAAGAMTAWESWINRGKKSVA